MKKKRENIEPYSAVAIAAAIIAAILIGLFFRHYLSFVEKTRDNEVASQLSEVYGQINRQFNELSRKNWNLLGDGALAFELSKSEDLIDAYIEQLRGQWGFNEWLFIDDNGNYMDTQGGTGYLNLGRDFVLLTQQKETIVVDGTLAGSDPVLLFAAPAEPGCYREFEFSAVALAYRKDALREVLTNSSYKGNSDCYLLYPDGRVLLSLKSEEKGSRNLFTLLREAEYDNTDFEEVHSGIQSSGSGTCRFMLNGSGYYLYYQPVGFQNWVMAGIVPQESVGRYLENLLRQTVTLSVLCVGLVMTALLIYLYYNGHRALKKKNEELSYREELFEILSGNSANMFVVILPDEKHTVEYVSSNAEQIIGISSESIARDSDLLQNADFPERPGLGWDALPEIRLGDSDTIESVRRNAKTGERLWFEETIYHVRIGKLERYIFVLQNRTKERESRINLKTALDIAKAANDSKSAFLSNMSHDIRTPMNVIIGFLPLLQRDADNPEKVREYARKINASSRHLLGLINDILDMSKIESGSTSLNVSEFELAELVEGLAMIIQPQAAAKQQTFEIAVRDIRYEQLVGDAMKLSQILVNILSNAVKYTPSGGRIEMTVRQLPQTTKNIVPLRFTVSDNGVGMSEEYLKVIFDPFTRGEENSVAKARGTGLGMSIVKSLLDLMGGSIQIESQLGEGSTFTVDLGIRIQEAQIDRDFWKNHHLFRTLVVDDDREICDNVVQTVTHSGLEMEYALGGAEALQKIRAAYGEKRSYDLVLLDWKMPGMDGLETAVKIRQIVPQEVPILVLTAYDWSDIEAEAQEAGIDGFLSKPFFLSNFMDTVDRICGEDEKEVAAGNQEGRMRGMHFLVAEDYELNAEILAGTLELYGVTCEICENGLETLRQFEASQEGYYDLILMDIRMPLMNGCEAARRIRGCAHPEARTIPIVAMSANAFSEDIQEAMAAGMNDYLTKPVDIDELETALIRILDKKDHGSLREESGCPQPQTPASQADAGNSCL